ncbi:MAG: hypothetical protein WCC10_03590 [Tumebacillaceae bacterium]
MANQWWMTGGLIVAGLLGVGMFSYSLAQQTALQGQINEAMTVINHSLVSTTTVVAETSEALQPLYETTRSLAEIERQEEATVAALHAMNDHLVSIAKSEQGIVGGLDSLNGATQGVSDRLTGMSRVTQDILQSATQSKGQAVQEANGVGRLNALTSQTIQELKQLNDKLYPLRLLP